MSAQDIFGPETKVGDPVCIVRNDRWRPCIVYVTKGQVERITATQVIALDDRRFSREHGHEVGGGYSSPYDRPKLVPLTAEILEKQRQSTEFVRAENACRKAAGILGKLTLGDAVRVAALLPDELKGGDV